MHRLDTKGRDAIGRLTARDLEEMGAMAQLRRVLGCERLTLQSVAVNFAGVNGFLRFSGYGSICVLADHGDEYDVHHVEFEASGSAADDARTLDVITILDDRDLPVAA